MFASKRLGPCFSKEGRPPRLHNEERQVAGDVWVALS